MRLAVSSAVHPRRSRRQTRAHGGVGAGRLGCESHGRGETVRARENGWGAADKSGEAGGSDSQGAVIDEGDGEEDEVAQRRPLAQEHQDAHDQLTTTEEDEDARRTRERPADATQEGDEREIQDIAARGRPSLAHVAGGTAFCLMPRLR